MVTARQGHSRTDATVRCGAATLVLLLAGCAGGGADGASDAKPSGGVPSTTTEVAPETPLSSALPATPAPGEAGHAEVLEVYRLMAAEYEKAYRAASAEGTDLERYMAPAAAGEVEKDLARLAGQGAAMRGALGHDPEVTALAAAAQPPTATVRDCVDASGWQTLETTTGWRIPRPDDQPSRYVATARMEHRPGERWKATAYTVDGKRSC
ncbi:secreted protein/lipoprotein [Streptomyces sp. B21-104]|uniref:secreted protein/lipoprotein n=1 Tax=Streptomyces sp. B21-104 TaxID=3039421 RepID=UPI0030D3F8E9